MKTSADWIQWLVRAKCDHDFKAALLLVMLRDSMEYWDFGDMVQMLDTQMQKQEEHDEPLDRFFKEYYPKASHRWTEEVILQKLSNEEKNWYEFVKSNFYDGEGNENADNLDDHITETIIIRMELVEEAYTDRGEGQVAVARGLVGPHANFYESMMYLSYRLKEHDPLFNLSVELAKK